MRDGASGLPVVLLSALELVLLCLIHGLSQGWSFTDTRAIASNEYLLVNRMASTTQGVSAEILAGIAIYPPSVTATWPPPNYVNPTLHPPTIIIFSAIFGFLALASTIGRLWSRFKVQGNGGVDDWCFLASLPFSIPLVFMTMNACSRFFNKVNFDSLHFALFFADMTFSTPGMWNSSMS